MISVQKINEIHSFSPLATISLLLFMYSSSEHCTEDFPRPNCDAWAPGVQHVNQNSLRKLKHSPRNSSLRHSTPSSAPPGKSLLESDKAQGGTSLTHLVCVQHAAQKPINHDGLILTLFNRLKKNHVVILLSFNKSGTLKKN